VITWLCSSNVHIAYTMNYIHAPITNAIKIVVLIIISHSTITWKSIQWFKLNNIISGLYYYDKIINNDNPWNVDMW